MAKPAQPNPFYSNHVFTDIDQSRIKLTWVDKLRVLFRRKIVQIGLDGLLYVYKRDGQHRYYLMDVKNMEVDDGT